MTYFDERRLSTDARELRDELLVLRCQLGEPTAFDELIRRWEGRLLYYLRRLVPQEADAWDALQRTWLAVFRDVRHLKEPRALRAWLYRVARNQAASHCRHERVHRSRVDEEADPDGIAESDWTPAVDEAERVHAALALLSLADAVSAVGTLALGLWILRVLLREGRVRWRDDQAMEWNSGLSLCALSFAVFEFARSLEDTHAARRLDFFSTVLLVGAAFGVLLERIRRSKLETRVKLVELELRVAELAQYTLKYTQGALRDPGL